MSSKKLIFLALGIRLAAVSLFAADGDESIINNLTNDINNYTKAATASKQNIDYQPFIVSVWDTNTLSKLGVLKLGDALALFTGVDISVDNVRHKSPIFRGSNPLAYGQSKLIIDGVMVNDRAFDGYGVYLDMPIELIKRIEIVRGPGSFFEGSNGYAGTINVVTYAKEGLKNSAKGYFLAGSEKSFDIGGVFVKQIDSFRLGVDFYSHTDDLKIDSKGKDALNLSPINSSLSRSGTVRAWTKNSSLGVSLYGDEVFIIGRLNFYELGSAFGNLYAIPSDDGRQGFPSWRIDGGYLKDISKNVEVEAKAGYGNDGWESRSVSYPPQTRIGSTVFKDGYEADLSLKNEIIYGSFSLRYKGLKNHTPKIGIYLSHEKNIDVLSVTTNKLTGEGLVDYSSLAPFFDGAAAKRSVSKLYLTDLWSLTDRLALSSELNVESGTDFKRQSDYRAALVWQVSDFDILKFMTGTSYRAPAWQELYTLNNPARIGNRELKPEKVKSYETQYIRKIDVDETVALNFFYLENKDQINKLNLQNRFKNTVDSTIYGLEAEYKKKFGESFAFGGYSFTDGEGGGEDYLPLVAKHTLKAGVLANLGGGFSAATTMIYIGEKKRVATDQRGALKGYNIVNLTLNYDEKRWGASFGVKNIGDSAALYPSEQNTYEGDYPTSKRFWFVKIGGRF